MIPQHEPRANRISRRGFLGRTAAVGAASVAPTIIPSSALGLDGAVPPSERVVVGGIGIGNRGTYDLSCFLQQPDVQFAAICDVKEGRRLAVKKTADEHHGNQNCEMYGDFRQLLDRSDIDAVLIATGPNWHGLMAMLAAKAGKDIYCEKPCTKNIAETLVHRDTMRRCGTVFHVCLRVGPHRPARQGEAGLCPSGRHAGHDERLAARGAAARPQER
jgi:hypothetical protein